MCVHTHVLVSRCTRGGQGQPSGVIVDCHVSPQEELGSRRAQQQAPSPTEQSAHSLSPFHTAQNPSPESGAAHPQLEGLPTSVYLIEIIPHRHAQRTLSLVQELLDCTPMPGWASYPVSSKRNSTGLSFFRGCLLWRFCMSLSRFQHRLAVAHAPGFRSLPLALPSESTWAPGRLWGDRWASEHSQD